jgi:hypothetical protein
MKSLFLLKKIAHLPTRSNDGDAKHRNVATKRNNSLKHFRKQFRNLNAKNFEST